MSDQRPRLTDIPDPIPEHERRGLRGPIAGLPEEWGIDSEPPGFTVYRESPTDGPLMTFRTYEAAEAFLIGLSFGIGQELRRVLDRLGELEAEGEELRRRGHALEEAARLLRGEANRGPGPGGPGRR